MTNTQLFSGCRYVWQLLTTQKPTLLAEMRVMQSSRNARERHKDHIPSSKGIYFFGREKEGKQQDLLILSCVSTVPQDLRSLTLGHQISMTEDQPLITRVRRKLGLMGGPRSQDGVWRPMPSDAGIGTEPRSLWGTNPTGWVKHIGVHPWEAFGIYPTDCLFGKGTALTSCLLASPRRSCDGHMEQGSGENRNLRWALQLTWQGASLLILLLLLLFYRLQEKEGKMFVGSLQENKPQRPCPTSCYSSGAGFSPQHLP